MSETMQALAITVLGERAELIEMPRPRAGKDEIVVKTWYSGVSVGTEMWIATGQRQDYGEVPFINGYQATGEVVEVGEGVENLKAGDVVVALCSGAHSEYVRGPAEYAYKLSNVDKADVTALWVQPAVAANALNQAQVNTGDSVLIIGQGLIGQSTAMLARLRGAFVIASDISPQRLETSSCFCADWTIDASSQVVSQTVRERFPDGVDVVMESTGFQGLLNDAMNCCADNGRFVFEGFYPGAISYDFLTPHRRQLRAFYPTSIGAHASREGVIRLIERGLFDIKPLISHTVSWRESAEIYNRLFSKERDNFNGILFDWRS